MENIKKKEFVKNMENDFSEKSINDKKLINWSIIILSIMLFIISIFLIILGNLKWGGSGIIFSFILNLYSIYLSLIDENELHRSLILILKIFLFIGEIIEFNYILM